MPFMKGPAPIRRTIKYLEAGRLYLKDQIKILTVNYNIHGQCHQGARYVKIKSQFLLPFHNARNKGLGPLVDICLKMGLNYFGNKKDG